jgi:hypothetical protein
LGVPEPKRPGIPTLGVGSADGPKALSEQQMIPDGLLGHGVGPQRNISYTENTCHVIIS